MDTKPGIFVSFNELKSIFPEVLLVNGDSIQFDDDNTYSQVETESESKTHKYMRETAMQYFKEEGYKVYPEAIGVKSIFTLADFALIDKANNLIFVECLSTNNSTQETIDKKLQLKQAGDVYFIFVRQSTQIGYSQAVKCIANDTKIYLYDYGNYHNGFLKKIVEYSEDIDLNKKPELEIKINVKRKYLYAEVAIPIYIYENKRKQWMPIDKVIKTGKMGKHRTKKKHKPIKNPVCYKFKIKDLTGMQDLKEYIEYLSRFFNLIYDKKAIATFQNKISLDS